jgi:hypothetical protein
MLSSGLLNSGAQTFRNRCSVPFPSARCASTPDACVSRTAVAGCHHPLASRGYVPPHIVYVMLYHLAPAGP